MITIDDNIPPPPQRIRHPLKTMKVGQSYFVPGRTSANVGGSFSNHPTKKFTSSNVTENGVKGVRVWRLS